MKEQFPGETRSELTVDSVFRISVITKGILSAFEVVAGFIAILIPPSVVVGYIVAKSERELIQEPGDYIATHVLEYVHSHNIPGRTFIAVYLITRGLLKLLLVVALLKKQYWAYPAAIVVLLLFMAYEIYGIIAAHSILMMFTAVFDTIVVWSVWREYRILIRHRAFSSDPGA
jgi:uncharacterized membrane protein